MRLGCVNTTKNSTKKTGAKKPAACAQAAGSKSIKVQVRGCDRQPGLYQAKRRKRVSACFLALMWALAGVLFAADVRAAFLAAFLASALFDAGCAWQGFGGLAIGFGNNFVAHDDS